MPKFWDKHAYNTPGEYGQGKGLGEGFAIVTHPALHRQKVYICSKNFVHGIAKTRHIPDECIASMLITPEFDKAVPEISLRSVKGLEIFRARLQKLYQYPDAKRVIIHCARGRNRSPVAALIYMVDRGVPYQEAHDAIMQSMRVRFPQFELNPYKNYTRSLNLLKHESDEKQINLQRVAHEESIIRHSLAPSSP